MSDMDVSPAVEATPMVSRKRWSRRWRVWLVVPVLLVVVLGVGLRVFVFNQSKSEAAVLAKFDEEGGDLEMIETSRSKRFVSVFETLGKIPGFNEWVLTPLFEPMGQSLFLAGADWAVSFPQSERGELLNLEEFRTFSGLRNVLMVDFSDQCLSKEKIESLAGMTWLKSLALDLSAFEEESETAPLFQKLESVQKLENLKLNLGHASPALAKWLEKQSQLTELCLYYQSISPEIVQSIAGLKGLKSLILLGPLQTLSGGPQTNVLQISHSIPPSTDLKFPAFRTLSITTGTGKFRGTEEIIHQMLQSAALTEVQLSQVELTDRLVADLCALKSLTAVGISQENISLNHLRTIASLPQLVSLNLRGSPLEDDAVDVINGCKQLKTLDVRGTKLSPEGVKCLSRAGLSVMSDQVGTRVMIIRKEGRSIVQEEPISEGP